MSLSEIARRALSNPRGTVESGLQAALDPVARRPSIGAAIRTTGRICTLLLGLALVAWTSGLPYIFPSLGPSAYALAVSPSSATSRPQRVFGGHLFGILGGLLTYHLFAPGLAVTTLPPALTVDAARLAASAVLSVGLTSVAMLATDLRHAPACATTLIVSLGLLSTTFAALIILTAVLLLIVLDTVIPGFGGVEDPPTY